MLEAEDVNGTNLTRRNYNIGCQISLAEWLFLRLAASEAEVILQKNFDKEQSNQKQNKKNFATYFKLKLKDGGLYSFDFMILRKDKREISRRQRKKLIYYGAEKNFKTIRKLLIWAITPPLEIHALQEDHTIAAAPEKLLQRMLIGKIKLFFKLNFQSSKLLGDKKGLMRKASSHIREEV